MTQAPPAPAAAPRQRPNLAIRIALGTAVVSLLLGVVVLVVSQDDDPLSAEAGPELAVRDYLDALANGDCFRLRELMTQRSLDNLGLDPDQAVDWCQMLPLGDLVANNVDVENVQTMAINGDQATVEFEVSIAGVPAETNRVLLQRENGIWKVDASTLGLGALDIPELDPGS